MQVDRSKFRVPKLPQPSPAQRVDAEREKAEFLDAVAGRRGFAWGAYLGGVVTGAILAAVVAVLMLRSRPGVRR